MRKEEIIKIFTLEQLETAKKAVQAKYVNPDGYERTFKDSKLCKYKVKFVDNTSVFVIMTDKQRAFFFRNNFSSFVLSLGGEGNQTKIL